MSKRFAIAGRLILTGLLFLLSGCGGPPEPPPNPRVIVKKIPAQQIAAPQSVKTAPAVAGQPAKDNAEPPPVESDADKSAETNERVKQKKQQGNQWLASIPGALQKLTASPSGQSRERSPEIKDGYDPTGKIDPFEPIFKTRERRPTEKKDKRRRRTPLTPLEKLDLSQLRLVGIIQAESGNRALVEETSGKGYIIKKGTYIGLNEGVVSSISKDGIIVRETVENYYGEVNVRNRELRIQKPPGEL